MKHKPIAVIFLLIAITLASTGTWAAPPSNPARAAIPENPLPQNYQSLPAMEKLRLLWSLIETTRYSDLPPIVGARLLDSVPSLADLGATFSNASDTLPASRSGKKFIHRFGSTATFQWEATGTHPFTGLFHSGGTGIIRLSLASDPRKIGFTPGMALKFLLNGDTPSVNILAMNSVDGQGSDTEFFRYPFSNRVPAATGLVTRFLGAIFSTVKKNPNELPVDHVAGINFDGTAVSEPVTPQQLLFIPTAGVEGKTASASDFRQALSELPPDTVLYDVMAKSDPQSPPVKIGIVRLTSGFIASDFGDNGLFFQHNMGLNCRTLLSR